MTTVTLYKNAKVNGTTRLSAFSTLAEQRNYFNSLTKKTFNIQVFTLGEPIKLNDSIANLIDYGYLSIDYGDGFRYYAYVSDFEFITSSQSRLIYVVDSYETAYLQTNMTFGRCDVSRINRSYGDSDYLKEVPSGEPFFKSYKFEKQFAPYGADSSPLYYVRRDSEQNKICYGYIPSVPFRYLNNGSWITDILGCLESDIWIAGVLPIEITPTGWTENSKQLDSYNVHYYETDNGKNGTVLCSTGWSGSISTTVYKSLVIKDMRGSIVYEFRPNETIDLSKIAFYVCYNASSISLRGRYLYTPTTGTIKEEESFVIPSELIDVYSDAWKEYYYRQRDSDLQARKQQVAEGTLTGLAGIGMSTVGGAIAGSAVPIIGTAVGAVAGLALGVIGVAINSGVQSYYNSQSQKTVDKGYQKASDTLVQTGNYNETFVLAGLYTCEYDTTTHEMVEHDIDENGKYVVGIDSFIRLPKGAFQGECEILGDIPNNWKIQIQQRLSQGVLVV